MSGLEETDIVFCGYCSKVMKEILLCKNKIICHKDNGELICKQRCKQIICSECEYCELCEMRIQELKRGLKKFRFGKADQTDQHKWYIDELKNNHDIEV